MRSALHSGTESPTRIGTSSTFRSRAPTWQLLQEQLRDGLAAEDKIRSAWLYGRVARGTDEPRSDVDVAIVLAEEGTDAIGHVRDTVQVLSDGLGVHISRGSNAFRAGHAVIK